MAYFWSLRCYVKLMRTSGRIGPPAAPIDFIILGNRNYPQNDRQIQLIWKTFTVIIEGKGVKIFN
jgi:hypothetical protein